MMAPKYVSKSLPAVAINNTATKPKQQRQEYSSNHDDEYEDHYQQQPASQKNRKQIRQPVAVKSYQNMYSVDQVYSAHDEYQEEQLEEYIKPAAPAMKKKSLVNLETQSRERPIAQASELPKPTARQSTVAVADTGNRIPCQICERKFNPDALVFFLIANEVNLDANLI